MISVSWVYFCSLELIVFFTSLTMVLSWVASKNPEVLRLDVGFSRIFRCEATSNQHVVPAWKGPGTSDVVHNSRWPRCPKNSHGSLNAWHPMWQQLLLRCWGKLEKVRVKDETRWAWGNCFFFFWGGGKKGECCFFACYFFGCWFLQ